MNNLEVFTVPEYFVETYKRLLTLMVEYGLDLVKDCKAGCDYPHTKLIECWNIFQAACCASILGEIEEANLLHKFVDAQLNLLYGVAIEDNE